MTRPLATARILSRTSSVLLLTLASVLGIAGCGGDSVPTAGSVHPVKGKVITKTPAALNGLKIQFLPKAGGTGRTASGEIKPDGSFDLKTEGLGDGICEGEYKVRLDRPAPLAKGKASPIPVEYFDEDGYLAATIKSDTTELPPFDLKPIAGAAVDQNRAGRKD